MKRLCINIVVFILMSTFSTTAQDLAYQNFSVKDGLPSNYIYQIHQDKDGFIWFGTNHGLSRYDGKEFINYTVANGLPDIEIFNLFEDSQNRLWFFTLNGKLGYYKDGYFYNSENTPFLKKSILDDRITDIIEDDNGNVFFSSQRNIFKLSVNNQMTLVHTAIKDYTIYKTMKDVEGSIWVYYNNNYSDKKIYRLSDLQERLLRDCNLNDFEEESLQKNIFAVIDSLVSDVLNFSKEVKATINEKDNTNYLINDKDIWLFGTNTPLQLLDAKSKKVIYTSDKIITTRGIVDKDKNIWLGSLGNGVYTFKPHHAYFYNLEEHTKGEKLTSFFLKPSNQTIYCGTSNGNAYIISKNKTKKIKFPPSLRTPRIRFIKEAIDSTLWFVSDGLVHLFDPKTLTISPLRYTNPCFSSIPAKSFYTNSSNGITLLGRGRGTDRLVYEPEGIRRIDFFNKRSTAVHVDWKGTGWVGTPSGLYYTNDFDNIASFQKLDLDDNISYINHVDSTLIVGTNGKGLLLINDDNIQRFTSNDELPSDIIRTIHIANDKSVWVSTNQGISKIENVGTGQPLFTTLTTQNGLTENNVLDCAASDSMLYVLSPKGITLLPMASIQNKSSHPKIQIEQLLVNNEIVTKDKLKSLTHLQNHFTVVFSGIYFGNRKDLVYNYKLHGYHTNWQTTSSNQLVFEQLPPNNYQLEIYASAGDSSSSHAATVNFEIVPAFYQRRSIQLFGFLLSGLFIFLYIKRYYEEESKKAKIQAKLLQLENKALQLQHKNLQSQMNPHFIKNSLAAIQYLILEKDLKSANQYLAIFGNLITKLIHQPEESAIILDEEIELLELYLSMEKLRFEDNFEYQFDYPSNGILAERIPSMMIQPIIENAIIHGFQQGKLKKKNQLYIELKPNDNYLVCTIKDNGIGIEHNSTNTKTNGISLVNINERIALLSKNYPKTVFRIEQTGENGTFIKLHLPILKHDQVNNN